MLVKKQWTFLPKANIEKEPSEDAIVSEEQKMLKIVNRFLILQRGGGGPGVESMSPNLISLREKVLLNVT